MLRHLEQLAGLGGHAVRQSSVFTFAAGR